MTRFPILDLCARIEGHEIQHRLLREHCRTFSDWKALLIRAEREGMSPLLRKHLAESESTYPISVRRSLDVLSKRHQHEADARAAILQEILQLLRKNDLTPLVIKGAALCYTTYPDIALRPMRDVDLLFRRSEVDHAQALMREAGFTQSRSPIPPNHYHLPALTRKIENIDICFELHRGLYPDCPPYYPEVDFEGLLQSAQSFCVGDEDALTFNKEETLQYIFQHAFRAPLTYESYKLINVADVIGFTEKNSSVLDIERVAEHDAPLYDALPLLHHISPWDLKKFSTGFGPVDRFQKMTPAPYTGWPQQRLQDFKAQGKPLHHIIRSTFLPSRWWTGIYYGAVTGYKRLFCLLWKHPRHVLWWVKLLSSINREHAPLVQD